MSKSNVLITEKQERTYSKVLSTPINKITKITKLPVTYRKALLVPLTEYKQYDGSLTTNNTMEELESDILKNDQTMKNSKIKEGYESYHEISSPLNKQISISTCIDTHENQKKEKVEISFIEHNESIESMLTKMSKEIEKLNKNLANLREDTQFPVYIHQLLQETVKHILGMRDNTLTTEKEREVFFEALRKYKVPTSTKPSELTPDLQKSVIDMYKKKEKRNDVAHPNIYAKQDVLKESILNVETEEQRKLYYKIAQHIGIKFD